MLDRVREGDPVAWRWFVDRYRGFVIDALLHMIRPAARAERATDDFWGYIYEQRPIDGADRMRRFRGYLVGILKNYARDWDRRDRGRHTQEPEDGGLPDLAQLESDQEETLWARNVLLVCLARLRQQHDRERQAMALCWYYGLPQSAEAEAEAPLKASEICRRLDIQPNAVHQLFSRAKKSMRQLVELELAETAGSAEVVGELSGLRRAFDTAAPGLLGL